MPRRKETSYGVSLVRAEQIVVALAASSEATICRLPIWRPQKGASSGAAEAAGRRVKANPISMALSSLQTE
jgi:hypothetical protein